MDEWDDEWDKAVKAAHRRALRQALWEAVQMILGAAAGITLMFALFDWFTSK